VAESVRVNLSVPGAVDAVLEELTSVTGRSKASLVMEAVGYQLPAWQRFLERARTGQIAMTREERRDLEQRETSPLSRQQRRAMERTKRKARARSRP
jgi:hypothetical protein